MFPDVPELSKSPSQCWLGFGPRREREIEMVKKAIWGFLSISLTFLGGILLFNLGEPRTVSETPATDCSAFISSVFLLCSCMVSVWFICDFNAFSYTSNPVYCVANSPDGGFLEGENPLSARAIVSCVHICTKIHHRRLSLNLIWALWFMLPHHHPFFV